MEKTIYIRLRHRVQVKPNDIVTIADIAQIICNEELFQKLKKIVVHRVSLSDKNIVIIDIMLVINQIKKQLNDIEIQIIGPSQTIIEIMYPKKTYSKMFFILVWLLLFFGSGLAIMNFHEDVSMKQVHQHIYQIITGQHEAKPLIMQVPYSIGLGLGMVLFFNHLFRKRFNEEPSPLEVEMFNYQQDLDAYVIVNENKESMKKIDNH